MFIRDYNNLRLIKTQAEADEVNDWESFFGSRHVWKVGDKCYWIKPQ